MYIDPSHIDNMIKKKRRDAGLSEIKWPRLNRSLLSVDSGANNNYNSALSLNQVSESSNQ